MAQPRVAALPRSAGRTPHSWGSCARRGNLPPAANVGRTPDLWVASDTYRRLTPIALAASSRDLPSLVALVPPVFRLPGAVPPWVRWRAFARTAARFSRPTAILARRFASDVTPRYDAVMNVQEIIEFLGGAALFTAAFAFLGKKAIDAYVTGRVEAFKNRLQLSTIEHQIRFAGLHAKRGEVIADLFGHLAETVWAADSFFSLVEYEGEPTKQEKYVAAHKEIVALYRFYDKNRVFLPSAACASLEKLHRSIRANVNVFGTLLQIDAVQMTDETRDHKQKSWQAGWKAIQTEIPAARRSLEVEFRKLLGDTVQEESAPPRQLP